MMYTYLLIHSLDLLTQQIHKEERNVHVLAFDLPALYEHEKCGGFFSVESDAIERHPRNKESDIGIQRALTLTQPQASQEGIIKILCLVSSCTCSPSRNYAYSNTGATQSQ